MEYKSVEEYINAIHTIENENLYIVGAGKYGKILGEYFNKNNITWNGYIDKRVELKQMNGKPVYGYEEVKNGYYIISTFFYRKEIMEELKENDVKLDQIILYGNHEIFFEIYQDLVPWKKYVNELKIFYKKYEGNRCFIIGNGPSLKIEDLENIKKEYSFASNAIYAIYAYTDWRPTYYFATDSIFCKQMMADKTNLKILMDGCDAAFTPILEEGIRYREDSDINQLYYMLTLIKESKNGLPYFSSDCSKQIYSAGSVTYPMLQLAIYMGFKQIYLLGMDFNYSVERHKSNNTIIRNDICNHMKIIEQEEKKFYNAIYERHNETYIIDIDVQLAGYQAAKQYADLHGIDIYNATRGGKLEVFPRVNFDDLF